MALITLILDLDFTPELIGNSVLEKETRFQVRPQQLKFSYY